MINLSRVKPGDFVTIRGRVVMALHNGVWIEGKSVVSEDGGIKFPPQWFSAAEIAGHEEGDDSLPEQPELDLADKIEESVGDWYDRNGLR